MKIERLRLFQYSLPLSGGRNRREGFLLKAESGQVEGWGDAAPLPGFSIEALGDVADYLRGICQNLRGVDLGDGLPTRAFFDGGLSDAPPSARFAVEQACLTLITAATGKPLRKYLAPDAPDAIGINALLVGSRDEVLSAARNAAASGYRCVKLKVGRESADSELSLAREVRAILGDGVELRLDANRAWGLSDAITFVRRLATPVSYVEEPLKNPSDVPQFVAATGVPVALDETLVDTPWNIWTNFSGVAAVIVKPTLIGGIYRAQRIAAHAKSRGQRVVVSAAFESGVGILALAELASALGDAGTAAGLDTYRWLGDDVLKKRPAMGSRVDLEALGPGLRDVDESKIEEMFGA